MKYITLLVLIAIMLSGCSSSSSTQPEETAPTISLKPEDVQLTEGQTTAIRLQLDLLDQAVFGISLRIDYLPVLVAFDESSDFILGSYFGNNAVSFVKSEGNSIYLTFSRIQGQEPVSGAGTVCTLSFTAQGKGMGYIEIPESEIHFYNSDGNAISISSLVIEETEIKIQ